MVHVHYILLKGDKYQKLIINCSHYLFVINSLNKITLDIKLNICQRQLLSKLSIWHCQTVKTGIPENKQGL